MQGVRVLQTGPTDSGTGVLSEWSNSSSEPCSTAALHDQILAVGLMTHIQVLEVHSGSGQLQERRRLSFQHQVSAVALFQPGQDVQVRPIPPESCGRPVGYLTNRLTKGIVRNQRQGGVSQGQGRNYFGWKAAYLGQHEHWCPQVHDTNTSITGEGSGGSLVCITDVGN